MNRTGEQLKFSKVCGVHGSMEEEKSIARYYAIHKVEIQEKTVGEAKQSLLFRRKFSQRYRKTKTWLSFLEECIMEEQLLAG